VSQARDPGEEWTDDRGWTHRRRDVGDVDLHYVAAGPVDADPVVLLHGFPEHWWAWRRHVDPLSESFRVLVPDMRGYNRSGQPDGVRNYRLEALAGDVAGLVAAEGYDGAHVVGHDWGGVVGFATGLRHPELLDRLVVLNAPHPAAFREQLTPGQALRSWYAGFFQLPAVPERVLSARGFAPLRRVFRELPAVEGAYADADVRRYVRAWRRDGSLRAMVDYYRALGRDVARGRLRKGRRADRVRAETLVLWGERDRALGRHIPDVIVDELPAVAAERYPEASHWLHAEFPARTAADVTDFLSR
jgi:pimeloyl-ACP methyl ester carboxylesterase